MIIIGQAITSPAIFETTIQHHHETSSVLVLMGADVVAAARMVKIAIPKMTSVGAIDGWELGATTATTTTSVTEAQIQFNRD